MSFTNFYLVISTVLLIILFLKVQKLKSNDRHYQAILKWVLLILVTQVIAITLLPLPLPSKLVGSAPYVAGAQISPGNQINNSLDIIFNPNAIASARITNIIQVVGNLLLLVPLCLALMMIFFSGKKAYIAVLICIGASVMIEIMQHLINIFVNTQWRIADIDDIILNSLGVIIVGIIYYWNYKKQLPK